MDSAANDDRNDAGDGQDGVDARETRISVDTIVDGNGNASSVEIISDKPDSKKPEYEMDVDGFSMTARNKTDFRLGIDKSQIHLPRGKIFALYSEWTDKEELIYLDGLIVLANPLGRVARVSNFHIQAIQVPVSEHVVGFVPRSAQLCQNSTIGEVLRLYGRLHNMSDDRIRQRTLYLSKVLELPHSTTRISELSKGGKGRVSLAAALLHSPSLLILETWELSLSQRKRPQSTQEPEEESEETSDETAEAPKKSIRERLWGKVSEKWNAVRAYKWIPEKVETPEEPDPEEEALRERIWEHLRDLTRREGVVIVLLCDTAKEACKADIVGIMDAWGRLVVQDSPDKLMEDLNCGNIYEAFDKIEDTDERKAFNKKRKAEGRNSTLTSALEIATKEASPSEDPSNWSPAEVAATVKRLGGDHRNTPSASWRRIRTLFKRDMALFKKRDFLLVLHALLVSVIAMAIVLAVGVQPLERPVAVVRSDANSTFAQGFLDKLKNDSVTVRRYCNSDIALEVMRDGIVEGVLEIGQASIKKPQHRFMCVPGTDGDNDNNNNNTSEEFALNVDLEAPNVASRFSMQHTLFNTFHEICWNIFESKNSSIGRLIYLINDKVSGCRSITHLELLLIGFCVYIPIIAMLTYTALSTRFLYEDTIRNLRLAFAGVRHWEIVVAHILHQLCVSAVYTGCVVFYMYLAYLADLITMKGSPILSALLIYGHCLYGITLGFAICPIFLFCRWSYRDMSDRRRNFLRGVAVVAQLGFICGSFWPDTVDSFVAGYFLYPKITLESLSYINYRGWGLERAEVRDGFRELARMSWIPVVVALSMFKFIQMTYRDRAIYKTRY